MKVLELALDAALFPEQFLGAGPIVPEIRPRGFALEFLLPSA